MTKPCCLKTLWYWLLIGDKGVGFEFGSGFEDEMGYNLAKQRLSQHASRRLI